VESLYSACCSCAHFVLFRCSVRSVQIFGPFCSDVQSVLFRCSFRSLQMFGPFCSDVQSVLFRGSVRSVQTFSPFCPDVQSVLFTFPACRPTAANCPAATDRQAVRHLFTLAASRRLKHSRWSCRSVQRPRRRHAVPHLPLCVKYVARSNAQVRANGSNKLAVD
jgi:hypothetical protein